MLVNICLDVKTSQVFGQEKYKKFSIPFYDQNNKIKETIENFEIK